METMTRSFAAFAAALISLGSVFGGRGEAVQAPVPAAVVVVTTTTQPPATTTTAPAGALCPQWWEMAKHAGWHADSMLTLDYVMHRESRCDPVQHNTTLNADGSTDIGLTQINDRSWCLPTKWYPNGYLQTVGVLSSVGCEQLFDPATNLKAAKAIYDYSQEANGDGFAPWNL